MANEWHNADAWTPNRPSMYDHEEVWLTRAEWDGPKRMKVRDIHPMMNAIGLKWRPVEPAEPPTSPS